MGRTPGGAWARLVVRLRWLILLAWIGGAVAATLYLPSIEEAQVGALGDLVPRDAPAIEAERASAELFRFPLISRVVVVQRDPDGLSLAEQLRAAALTLDIARGQPPPGLEDVAAAITLPNTLGLLPGARERTTATLTYLYFRPEIDRDRRLALAREVAARLRAAPGDARVGVTGALAARVAQADLIQDRLPLVELATVALVALAVGLHFRAPGPPLLTLATVAVAYGLTVRLVAWLGQQLGVSVPSEVQPVIVVLLFGVITDYTIFLVARFRRCLAEEGQPRREAAARTAGELSGVVMTAGLAVAVAAMSLIVARVGFLQAFGPGLAMSVLLAAVVAATFVPAALAVLGGALLWPGRRGRGPEPVGARAADPTREARGPRSWAVRLAAGHPWLVALGTLLALGACASRLADLQPANPLVRGLPPGQPARAAYVDASRGFVPGLAAPTVVVVREPGIVRRRAALVRLQRRLEAVPGVAAVLGPRQQPVDQALGAALSRTGDAARFAVIFEDDPLGAGAIAAFRRLQARMPELLAAAGLPRAEALFAGDTALSAQTIARTRSDLARVAPFTLLGLLVVLGVFLRAVVAPLYLVAASAVAVAAALGLGVLAVQEVLGYGETTYYVPFAAAVLLVSLGSDSGGLRPPSPGASRPGYPPSTLAAQIWQEMPRRGLREAVVLGGSRASPSIAAASLVLAGSFALLALVPIRPFRELAVVMAVGLLLDAFVVRTLLVPALVTLVGRRSTWPRTIPATPPAAPQRP